MNLAGVSAVVDGAPVGVAVVGGAVEGSVLVLPGGREWVMHLNWHNYQDRTRRIIRMKEKSCRKWKRRELTVLGASALLSLLEVTPLVNRCGTTSSLTGYLSDTDVNDI